MLKLKHPLLVVAVAIISLMFPPPAMQQHAAARSEQASTIEELRFPGGPIQSYIVMVRRTFDEANIVLAEDAKDFVVPPVELRNVSLDEATYLLERVARPGEGRPSRPLAVHQVGSVWTVTAPAPTVRPSRPDTDIISGADVLMVFSAADVLTSVESALELLNEEPSAELRLHEETGLFIVRGTRAQLSVVREAIGQLRVAADSRRQAKQVISLDEHREVIAQLEAKIRLQTEELHHLQLMLDRLQRQLDTQQQ